MIDTEIAANKNNVVERTWLKLMISVYEKPATANTDGIYWTSKPTEPVVAYSAYETIKIENKKFEIFPYVRRLDSIRHQKYFNTRLLGRALNHSATATVRSTAVAKQRYLIGRQRAAASLAVTATSGERFAAAKTPNFTPKRQLISWKNCPYDLWNFSTKL